MSEDPAPYTPLGGRSDTICPVCKEDSLKYDFVRKSWWCQKCGWLERRPSSAEMVQRCRAGQKAMGDNADEPGGGPITPGPFVDDHGEMPTFLPYPDLPPEGP